MKILLFIFGLLILSNCASQTSVDKIGNGTTETDELIVNANKISNTNSIVDFENEREKIDKAKRKELEAQNEKFRQVPDEFKNVDFENFTYPTKAMKGFIKLQNGGFGYEDRKECDNHFGELESVFYVNLRDEKTKHAIVNITDVACGCGSCDGGSYSFYVYEMKASKPHLLWRFATGSFAYGLGLKSFSFKEKQIVIEEFDKCSEEEAKVNWQCSSKFVAKNVIRTTFIFNGKTFIQKSKELVNTPASSVKNYSPEISINE